MERISREKLLKRTVSYHDHLIEDLKKDPEETIAYLNAAIQYGDRDSFLLALRHVIEAYGPIIRVARQAHLHRVSLHKMLSRNGNPTTESLLAIFRVLGIRLQMEKKHRHHREKLKKAA